MKPQSIGRFVVLHIMEYGANFFQIRRARFTEHNIDSTRVLLTGWKYQRRNSIIFIHVDIEEISPPVNGNLFLIAEGKRASDGIKPGRWGSFHGDVPLVVAEAK